MRIIHILNHIKKTGNGIVNVAIDLACLQAQAGHCVGVAALEGEYQTLLNKYGVQFFRLDQSRKLSNLIKMRSEYRQILQEFQPEIVHAHMMTGVVLTKSLRMGNQYQLISTVHNEFQRSATLMGWADQVIAVSQAVANSMQKRGVPASKLQVVFNGTLGSPRSRPIHEYEPLPLRRPAITTVAGMYQRKGIAELIAAFNQIAPSFPNAHLYLIGDGPDRASFEAQAQKTTVADRIHFEKFQSEPQRYLRSTDIFVLASHKDPSPLVIPEAREAGCAIIASAVDGIPEALDHGQAGLLIPPNDIASLAEALHSFLSDDVSLKNWKKRSQQNVEWLNVTRVCDETLKVYRDCLNLRSPHLYY